MKGKHTFLWSLIATIALATAFASSVSLANAATITFISPIGLAVTSPLTTLTIASGSVADLVTLNATSVIISLSGNENLVLTSPSYDLSITSSASGGSVTNSCSNKFVTASFSQNSGSTTYTVVPSGNSCSNINLNPSSSSLSGMTTSQMQTLLASLESELKALEAQAGSRTSPTSPSPSPTPTPAKPPVFTFTRDLQSGMTGNDVKQLQIFLIAQNAGSAARAIKTHGLTTNFATLTKVALIEFQKSVGISPASGYFGAITRRWVNAHY